MLLTAQCAGCGDILPLPRHADPDTLGVAVDSTGEGDGDEMVTSMLMGVLTAH